MAYHIYIYTDAYMYYIICCKLFWKDGNLSIQNLYGLLFLSYPSWLGNSKNVAQFSAPNRSLTIGQLFLHSHG
jgi:hypothetical protein